MDSSPVENANQSIPFAPPATGTNALGLSNPDGILSGTTRGTQNVGNGGAALDGASNQIILQNPVDGSRIGLGVIPGSATNEFGFFTLDSSGNVIMKIVGGVQTFYDGKGNMIQKIQNGTTYVYDPSHGYANVTQAGLLPDGSGGFVVAKPGINVSDAFS